MMTTRHRRRRVSGCRFIPLLSRPTGERPEKPVEGRGYNLRPFAAPCLMLLEAQ